MYQRAIARSPDLHRIIEGARGNAFAIRRPRDGPNLVTMTMIDVGIPAIGYIPQLYGLIVTGRGNTFTIRRPRDSLHHIRMPRVGVNRNQRRSLIHYDGMIRAP